MNMLKRYCLILLILVLLLITGCKKNIPYTSFDLIDKDEINIVVTSDLHFLSKTMVEEGSNMLKENYYGDGRIICYNEELIDAFIYQMIKEKPDVVIITGDLTFDGSYQNHLELTKKLKKLINNNIRVLVTPGNHDINNAASKKYLNGSIEKAKYLSAKDYENIYFDYGRGNSINKDKNSYSYFYQISDTLGVLMLDSNCYDMDGDTSKSFTNGVIKEETLEWIEQVLKYYKNLDIIAASHHNLFTHSTMFKSGYQIDNHDDLRNILNKYNVKLYLSGHMHIQHINNDESITEVLTSALSITPHQYGVIKYSKHDQYLYRYSTTITNVSEYHKSINSTDPNLLDFSEYSKNFYKESSYKKAYEQIMFHNSSLHKEAEALGRLMSLLNGPYFEGSAYNIVSDIKETEDYQLINKINMKTYIDSIIDGSNIDHRYVNIER